MIRSLVITISTLILSLFPALVTGTEVQETIIADSPEQICPLKVGSSIPSIELTRADGEKINLEKTVKEKPTVLIFYRGGW